MIKQLTLDDLPSRIKEQVSALPKHLQEIALKKLSFELHWNEVVKDFEVFQLAITNNFSTDLYITYNNALHGDRDKKPKQKLNLYDTLDVDGRVGKIVGCYFYLFSKEHIWSYLVEFGVDDCFYYPEYYLL